MLNMSYANLPPSVSPTTAPAAWVFLYPISTPSTDLVTTPPPTTLLHPLPPGSKAGSPINLTPSATNVQPAAPTSPHLSAPTEDETGVASALWTRTRLGMHAWDTKPIRLATTRSKSWVCRTRTLGPMVDEATVMLAWALAESQKRGDGAGRFSGNWITDTTRRYMAVRREIPSETTMRLEA
jgi:hypothetical protein